MPDTRIKQLKPAKNIVKLKGLYLAHNLKKLANKLGRMIVIANYVTDINDAIAIKDQGGAPKELKNPYDWRLFQELQAQADVIVTGADYLQRFSQMGEKAQNVLTQFEKGGEFEELGVWRMKNGYIKRSPDIVVLSRSMDFKIPEGIVGKREIMVFTTYKMTDSKPAKEMKKKGAEVIGAGEDGVDGGKLYNSLQKKGYQIIKITTGPRVLKIFRDAGKLDRLYITQVQTKLDAKPDELITVMLGESKISENPNYKLVESYLQEEVKTDDGSTVDQKFLVYNNTNFQKEIG